MTVKLGERRICKKCHKEKPILVLRNGVGEMLDLCVDCHGEFMKIAKEWLKEKS